MNLQDIIADPEFSHLTDADKKAVLSHLTPDFGQLQTNDQQAVLDHLGVSFSAGQSKRKADLISQGGMSGDVQTEKGGFLQGLKDEVVPNLPALGNALLHPVDATENLVRGAYRGAKREAGQTVDAIKRGDVMEAGGHALATALPVIGPAAASAAEDIKNGDIGYGLGRGAGLIGQAVSPELASRTTGALVARAPAMAENAAAKCASIFGKSARQQALAEKVVPRLMAERMRIGSTGDLAQTAENNADVANTAIDHAIGQSAPLDANAVRQNLLDAQRSQFQSVGGNAAPHGPAQVAPTGPDSQAVSNGIGGYRDSIIEPNVDANGQIAPQNARTLRQMFDKKPAASGAYAGNDALPADVQARQNVAGSLRTELNKDPAVRAANEDANFWLNVKNLAQHAPQSPRVMDTIENAGKQAIAGGLVKGAAGMLGGPASAAAGGIIESWAAMKVLRDIPKSAMWKSTTALMRSDFARALQRGDWAKAARTGMGIVSGMDVAQNNQ